MVTKKSPTSPAPKSPAPTAKPRATPRIDDELPEAPGSDDPEKQAEYFIELLQALDNSGDAEAKKIRLALIAFVAEYRDTKKEDPEKAKELAYARLVAFEVGLSEVLLKSTKKLHDNLVKESRKLGTSSTQGKAVRQAAESFGNVVEALNMMLESARKEDPKMRAEAHKKLAEAKALVEGMG